jgi:uncharacterized membrane protein YkoI
MKRFARVMRVKKSGLFLLLAAVLLFGLAVAASAATRIGEARATAIALEHAGVKEAEAQVVEFRQYEKRGMALYQIKFFSGGARYYYEINAETGEIVEFHRGARHDAPDAPKKGPENYIGVERAKEIAFTHAGVDASKVYRLDIDIDREKGVVVYEVDFKCDGWEYDYKIDVLTGDILEWDKDRD